MDMSIIIVSFNTKERLRNCLNSIRQTISTTHFLCEIVVVDNASEDGSREMVEKEYRECRLIKNQTNEGFAKANNRGIKQSQGKYILLLNSDTIIFKDTLKIMVEFMESRKDAGVATCRVELADRKLDPACHRGFPTPWASFTYFSGLEKLFPRIQQFAQYHQTYKDLSKIHEIDSCSGAFYLIRKNTIEDVGLLDEDYFMYGEDLDWSYRIKQKGWKIFFNPNTKIIHYKKQSGLGKSGEVKKVTTKYFYKTMELFYKKHFINKYPRIVTLLVLYIIRLKSRLL